MTGDADGVAHVRNATVLTLLAGRADFHCYDAPCGGLDEGIRDKKRVLADLDEFVIRQVGRVPCRHHLLDEPRISSLVEAQHVIVGLDPIEERIIILAPSKDFVEHLDRKLEVALLRLVVDPFPELRYLVQRVVRVARSNEDVRIEEV